ncbi:MAG: hypothetical protein ACOYO1_06615 [Bacteroidales bacterium]
MRKITLDFLGWKTILFKETGLPLMEQELRDVLKEWASNKDLKVILAENDLPTWILNYNIKTNKFETLPIVKL